jgi:hypothetical protein
MSDINRVIWNVLSGTILPLLLTNIEYFDLIVKAFAPDTKLIGYLVLK